LWQSLWGTLCRSNSSILKLTWYSIAQMFHNLFNNSPMMSQHFLSTLLPHKQCCDGHSCPYILTCWSFYLYRKDSRNSSSALRNMCF
jgi:hypothetical protein